MCCIAAASRCVTVVGDPDQSSTPWLLILSDLNLIHNYVVYGWRSADITNLGKMQNGKIEATHIAMHWTDLTRLPDFLNVVQIMLEQNYRSAGSILATSLAIISQGEFCRYFKCFYQHFQRYITDCKNPAYRSSTWASSNAPFVPYRT